VNNVANQIMFKVNDARTRTLFNTRVNAAMERLRRAGIISQYNVVCNENNNTQDIIDAYAFKAYVQFVPALTIETITLEFNTERSGTTQVTSTSSSSLIVEDAQSGTIISDTTGNISY
jgi:phage tail sheath protein FI